MILLDTDHVSFLQRGGAEAQAIVRHFSEHGITQAATTIVTYEEQVRGWLGKIRSARTLLEEVRFYAKLNEQLDFYGGLAVVPFTEKAAVELQRLRRLQLRVPTMDLKIAAIALANGATLWSRNLRDFAKVPALHVKDATA